jgi:hypothetical protein
MEFRHDDYTFIVPDHPTVRQQLEYFSAGAGLPIALRYWECAKALIQTWECAKFPDHTVNLDSITDPAVTTIILTAGMEVMQFMNKLDEVPKN